MILNRKKYKLYHFEIIMRLLITLKNLLVRLKDIEKLIKNYD